MDFLTVTPSGATFSSVYETPRSDLGLLFQVATPSVSCQFFVQTAPESSGPFYDLNRHDGTGLVFVVASGQLAQTGVAPVPGLGFVRLRVSTAIAPTSVGIALSRRP